MKDKGNRFSGKVNIKNKRASYEYEFIEKYVAGLVLKGTEIKSIREGKVNIQDGYCLFHGQEMYVRNLHISPYKQGTYYNHEPTRERKLLLNKRELKKLKAKSEEKGLSIVLIRLFTNERSFAKLEIALARGKKIHDKRQSIKEKDLKRELKNLD
ncbi:MAG: SsrA-binding protein SmpB [Bacteroidota bacterium]